MASEHAYEHGSMEDDAVILQRLAAGDPSAVSASIDRFGSLVWMLALRMTPSRTDAEDAVQEVFTEIWRVAGRFDPNIASARAFVAMIARRRLIDRARSNKRHQRVGALGEDPSVAAVHSDPSGGVVLDEDAERARAAIEQLRPEQQKVIRLAIGESWTHERIAEHLGMPLGTVKTHLRRGLLKVREILSGRSEPQEAAP